MWLFVQGVLSVVPFKGGLVATYILVVQGVLSVVPFQVGLVATYVACSARSARCSAFSRGLGCHVQGL